MSVQLEIQDGSPHWWLSLDVWTVPGDDPEGSPGLPIVGKPCYLWARVRNTGATAVTNATVRFYWANPGVGFDRTSATHIGDANVSLGSGETKEVLCLVAWNPIFVNGGHECILAEAFHTSLDPLPAAPAFNVPTDRHVAQRNLSVLTVSPQKKFFSLPFEIHNTTRTPQVFTLKAELGELKELKSLLRHTGRTIPQDSGKLEKLGFTRSPNPCDADENGEPVIDRLEVAGGMRTGLTLTGELQGEVALVHIFQEVNGVQVGGLSALVVSGDRHNKKGRE